MQKLPPTPTEQGLQLAFKLIVKQEDLQQVKTWSATTAFASLLWSKQEPVTIVSLWNNKGYRPLMAFQDLL